MVQKTGIQWVQDEAGNRGGTWNPLTGCTKISPGCANCYAETRALELQKNPLLNKAKLGNPYRNGFDLTLHPHKIDQPLRVKQPTAYFVNSMSDLFHGKVPQDFIRQVFATMNQAHWHRFMILTKRADRLALLADQLTWTPNIWMGVSVESQEYLSRVDYLRQVPAAVRWISAEPLLGPLPDMNLGGISWVVVGGESGKGARPFDLGWARDIMGQCQDQGAAFFMKQMGENPIGGGFGKSIHFKDKKGGKMEEWPEDLQIRQMPIQPAQGQIALNLEGV